MGRFPALAHKGMGAEKCDFGRALQDRAHTSRALSPGLFCVLKIGFFAAICPEKLLKNGVIGDF
jgi:hypothetical protein